MPEDIRAADPNTYYLVDASGFIFRAFHALPMMNRPSDRTPVNAVYGFTGMLMRLIDDLKVQHLAVIFDASGTTFRTEIFDQYKANRGEPPEELVPQFALVREATRAFGLKVIEKTGYEADDLIATYCRAATEAGQKAVIVSSDKDLMQLVSPTVSMFDPMKNRVIGAEEVAEKFGVPPDRVIDVQALAGDTVDNIPGVPGIGVKTAAQLITDFGDLDALLERAVEIKQPKRRQNLLDHAEMARLSRRLVTLAQDVPLEIGLDDLDLPRFDPGPLTAFLGEQGFKSLTARAAAWRQGGAGTAAPGVDAEAPLPPEAVEADYKLVTTPEGLEAWIALCRQVGVMALDTETTGLDASRAGLVGISLAHAPGAACYIPIGHSDAGAQDGLVLEPDTARPPAPEQMPLDTALALLKPLLEDDSVLKVGQNLKYDYQILARHGIRVTPVDDTMLLSYVLDGTAHGHGMDELAQLHLGHATTKIDSLIGKGKAQITFDRVPIDKALHYAAEDADITLRLWRLLKPRLAAERMTQVYERIERPMITLIGEMETAGIKLDPAILKAMSEEFATRLGTLEGEVHDLAGRPFNLGSPKQLGEVLFDELGLPAPKKTKTGAYATGSEVLEPLAHQGFEICQKLLDWRQLSKLKSTYTDALQEAINPRTGRVHTSFSLAVTATGRLSSNDPNLQNIPVRTEAGRKIRTAFVAEPGHKLVSIDYSQIELRIVAHAADIGALKQAFVDGTDIHALTAAQVFGVPIADMTPEVRRRAKAINFGIIYGISAFGLAQQLGIPQGEASRFIKAYLERFSELKAWMDTIKAEAKKQGHVRTLFGRKCVISGIGDKNPARRGFAERQAINAPIQGTAADIIKRALARIPAALAAAGLSKARRLLQVHDELVFEVPEGDVDALIAAVRPVMEGAASLSVPLVAEAGVGDTWGEAH